MNVLDHDDRIVDENTDGENQGEQRHAVDREAPCPRRKQCQHQRDDDRGANHNGFAPAQRDENQDDHRDRRKSQFLDKLPGLVIGGLAVIASDRVLDAVRNRDTAKCVDTFNDFTRYTRRVGARLFRDRERYGRGISMANVLFRLVRPGANLGHVVKVDRFAVDHADDKFFDIRSAREELAGRDRHVAVARNDGARVRRHVARLQRHAQRVER